MDAIETLFSTWWKKPFDQNGDATMWILFLGFTVVVSYGWTRVLDHIKNA